MLQKVLVTLFSRIQVPAAGHGKAVGEQLARALNAEAASFGYGFDADLMARIAALPRARFDELRGRLLPLLGEVCGGNVTHRALFNKFPYDTPDHWDYLVRRLIGIVQTAAGMRPNQAQVLSCGHVVDSRIFNLDNFGACPVCQFQVPETSGSEEIRHAYRRITPLKILSAADDGFLCERAAMMLARPSSLSADEKAFLREVAQRPDLAEKVTLPERIYRETLPFAYLILGERLRDRLSGATDLLRIASFLSDPEADLSLTRSVRFKLSTRHKKALMRMLEGLDNIEEDLLRHRERWLRLGEILTPGTAANRRRFPRTAAVFDRLRNDPSSIKSFSREVDRKVRARVVDAELLALLVTRPGELLRRLDFLLRTARSPKPVLGALKQALPKASSKTLFEVRKYLTHRAVAAPETRAFIPKGVATKIKVVPDQRAVIPGDVLEEAIRLIDAELSRRLSVLPAMGKVYIDPALCDIVMPFNRRGDSSTSAPVTKGSRYAVAETAEVVRLFVWWRGDVDVDLSLALFDQDFEMVEQISWTRTSSGMTLIHSGDVRNAPDGGSEFIDFEIDDLLRRGVRYAATSVTSYRGETFDMFPCFAGFMERDSMKSGRKYEPESVALKFDLAVKNTSHIPLIFDLAARQMVFADIAFGMGRYGTVVGQKEKLAATAKVVLDLSSTKPTAYDVLHAHASARGTLVRDPDLADLVFTRDALDLEAVVAMMEA